MIRGTPCSSSVTPIRSLPRAAFDRPQPGDLVQVSPEFPPQALKCDVQQFNFSAHGSRESLRAYVNRARPRKIILVHGDAPAIEWFRAALSADLPESEILTPTPGLRIEL